MMSQEQPGSTAALHTYRYTPLSAASRDIRLLTLQPGPWNDAIQCSTHVVCLDDHPEYETISYVWGSLEHQEPIQLDGYWVNIRQNLEAALRHLRNTDRPLTLWADALCIN